MLHRMGKKNISNRVAAVKKKLTKEKETHDWEKAKEATDV